MKNIEVKLAIIHPNEELGRRFARCLTDTETFYPEIAKYIGAGISGMAAIHTIDELDTLIVNPYFNGLVDEETYLRQLEQEIEDLHNVQVIVMGQLEACARLCQGRANWHFVLETGFLEKDAGRIRRIFRKPFEDQTEQLQFNAIENAVRKYLIGKKTGSKFELSEA